MRKVSFSYNNMYFPSLFFLFVSCFIHTYLPTIYKTKYKTRNQFSEWLQFSNWLQMTDCIVLLEEAV